MVGNVRKLFLQSVMNLIHVSLFAIIAVALLSIFFSFWISEKSDNDARAINLAGSMRMQTYHIGLLLSTQPQKAEAAIQRLDETWHAADFAALNNTNIDASLQQLYRTGEQNWSQLLKPRLLDALNTNQAPDSALIALLDQQVMFTDQLVQGLQLDAEQKVRQLRTLQLFALLLTVLVGSLIFHLLKHRIEAPLKQLTDAARAIAQGKFRSVKKVEGADELALLSQSFNRMSTAINQTYQELEQRVTARTEELQRHNTMLNFLFDIARSALEHNEGEFDHQHIVSKLAKILDNEELELCLFTEQGERPYLQYEASDPCEPCETQNCQSCKGAAPFDKAEALGLSHIYPIAHEDTQFGVLRVQDDNGKALPAWKDQLLRSCADQLALALSLSDTKAQEHRLTLLNERTVIARELHDSLAQSLSYLQIQVTRLQKSHDKQKYDMQQPIINELRDGLSASYRHLRELLTTFRLKVDGEGLKGALEQTIALCQERSAMTISLDYALQNLPLSPKEEIHLLQIAREATQNAMNHSQGHHLRVQLQQAANKQVVLTIEDDGIGLSEHPEKLNHYGLAIMQERARHLDGALHIEPGEKGGTRIRVIFSPHYLQHAA